ncbi:MAG: 2-amino-4-hydroxy-6-hydroxymethyldihydropteridine diphosphokinase [Acidobacteriota bacterium]
MTGTTGPVALLLGGNLGRRALYLELACKLLAGAGSLEIAASSSVFETEPVETEGVQPWYLNQVLLVETRYSPEMLLNFCVGVEAFLGRRRTGYHGPRTLDIDILFYDGIVRKTPRLVLPHPALVRRKSILAPLADVAPRWRHPLAGKTVREMLGECADAASVTRCGEV